MSHFLKNIAGRGYAPTTPFVVFVIRDSSFVICHFYYRFTALPALVPRLATPFRSAAGLWD
jgi:hypothetical protein